MAATARSSVPETVYVNFEGTVLRSGCGNDARLDCSTLAERFDGYVGPFRGNATQRMAILQAARKGAADFGIRIVTRRPPPEVPYTMIVYGELGEQSFAGVAPYLDCGDERRGDTAFSQGATSSNTGATLILHEAGHTWGLEHVDTEADIMHPSVVSGLTQTFVDDCLGIVADTDLGRTAGTCNEIHTRYCEPTFQNSWQTLSDLFGPSLPDVEAPELAITFPVDGATFEAPVSFTLRAEIDDDLHPQFYDVELFDGETPVATRNDLGIEDDLELLVERPPPGEYALRVVLADGGGNTAEDMVRFTILPEGTAPPPEDSPEAPPSGCRVSSGGTGWPLLLLLAGVRRRKFARTVRCSKPRPPSLPA
jgi:hypothetical protein